MTGKQACEYGENGDVVRFDDDVMGVIFTDYVANNMVLLSYTNGRTWCASAEGYLDVQCEIIGKFTDVYTRK